MSNGHCVSVLAAGCPSAHSGEDDDAYEPDECSSLATIVSPPALGSAIQHHTLAPVGDVDWLRLKTLAGHSYELKVFPYGFHGAKVQLRDENLAPLPSAMDPYTGSLRFNSTAGKDFLIELSAFAENPGTASYSLEIIDQGADDHGETTADATPLPLSTDIAGHLPNAADVDVFKFPGVANHVYVVGTRGSGQNTTYIQVRRATGQSLGGGNGFTGPYVIVSPATEDLFVFVSPMGGFNTTPYPYVVRAEDRGVDDHGNTPQTASPFPQTNPAVVTTSYTYPGDDDFLSFTAAQGETYRIDCSTAEAAPCWARVTDASGATVASGWSSGVAVGVGTGGTLYATASWASVPDRLTHTLSLTRFLDDHGDTVGTATAVNVGATVSGNLGAVTEADVFAVQAPSGHFVSFQCSSSQLQWFTISTLSATGATIDYRNSAPYRLYALVPSAGVTLFKIGGGSPELSTYQCTFLDEGSDDHGDTAATATVVSPGSSVVGRHETANDEDFFAISTQPNHVYRTWCADTTGSTSWSSRWCHVTTDAGTRLFDLYNDRFVLADGPIYIRSSSMQSPAFTPYAVLALDVGADQEPDTRADALVLARPTPPTTARSDTVSDLDVFRLDAQAHHQYLFRLTSSGGASARMTDASGNVLSTGTAFVIEYGTDRTVYFEVFSGRQELVPFTYELQELGFDDHVDVPDGATDVVPPVAALAAQFEDNLDLDVLRFVASANVAYRISCSGQCTNIKVRTADSTTLYSTGRLLEFRRSQTEALFPEFRGTAGAYSISVEVLGADDHGDAPDAASPAGAGVLEYSGDVDTFLADVTAGRVYRFSATSDAGQSASVRFVSAGSALTATVSGRVAWKASLDGGVFAQVLNPIGGTPLPYFAELTDIGTDDCGDTIATSCPFGALGQTLTRAFEPAFDSDVFAASVPAGHVLRARCSVDAGSSCNPVILNDAGTVLAVTNPPTMSYFEAAAAQEVFVRVTSNTQAGEQAYAFALDDLGVEDVGDTKATASSLTANVPFSAKAEHPNDVDVFVVALPAGSATVLVGGMDGRLEVRSPSGATLSNTLFSSPGTSVSVTAATAGDYEVRVSPRVAEGAYSVEVR